MNVEPAPVSFTDTLGFTTAVDVEVDSEVTVDSDVDVTVVVFAPPEVTMYAPAPATTITTTTIAPTIAVLIPVLSNFIYVSAAPRSRFMAPRQSLLHNIELLILYEASIVHCEKPCIFHGFRPSTPPFARTWWLRPLFYAESNEKKAPTRTSVLVRVEYGTTFRVYRTRYIELLYVHLSEWKSERYRSREGTATWCPSRSPG